MNEPLRILNAGLMIDAERHGFQLAMEKVATGGYAEIHCGATDFNTKVVEMARALQPHIIFLQIQQEGALNHQTAHDLSQIGFTMSWTGDVRHSVPSFMMVQGGDIHLTLFSNEVDVETCRKAGIRSDFLNIGFEPERYNRHGIIHPCEDIVAMFNDYGDGHFPLSQFRREIVWRLKSEFGDKFGVYGRFQGASGNFNGDQRRESEQYNSCKIAINCSHFNYRRYSSDRLQRITGSGAFCLTHNFDGVDIDWKPGENLATFDSIDDLIHKCHFYLNSEAERKRIADNGFKEAHINHTYDSMVKNIINLYLQYSGK